MTSTATAELDLAVVDRGDDGEGTDPGGVSVLLGNGDGTFRTAVAVRGGTLSQMHLVAGDFNGDGRTDLAVVDGGSGSFELVGGGVSVLLGNGDGTFQSAGLLRR